MIHSLLTRLFSLRLLVAAFAVTVAAALVPGGLDLAMVSTLDRTLFDLVMPQPAGASLSPEAFRAVLAERQITVPPWGLGAALGGIGVSLLFLVLAVPRMGTAMATLITLFTLVALVVTQSAFLLYRQQWLALGPVLTVLAVGFVVMLFWLQPHRQIRALRDNARQARYQLGKLLLQQGQTEEALECLALCPASDQILELQYEIALQQERKRQYNGAARTYQQILSHRKKFRDARERLASLMRVTGDTSVAPGGGLEATRTLVISDAAVSKPILGRYEIERELGRGAMGVVYLGKDPKISRTVAIKTFNYQQFEGRELQDLKARFFREAEAAGRLNHPDIVTVYDVGEEADLAYIAMDYAQGKPLSAYGKPNTLLPLPVVLELVARVAEALDYAHGQKIIHRDIKPGNLLYNAKTGDLKITDFGIAKIADDSRTRTGSVMGSPLYMAPEQLRGQKVTGASDIYSLGVTLYRLVSGYTPFQADSLANLTYQVLNRRPTSVREYQPELPEAVVRIINKAIQREPGKRFASAAAMAEAVRRAGSRQARQEAS
ncbi:MAG: protein kinase [Marinobacter sp.]|uniref:protein kinase domain-containing protein n=1 Tax=Marinobacter sp. TaxID=50741 RepID=UPI00299E309F|nr:protein kinase [Marinobacter sp.]MDX1634404.1 protein kinase [Marinobacter sp.]